MRDATSAWVDAEHPDVQQAAHAFRSVLQTHLRIPSSEWESVLRRAVQRTTAYLIHPTQTMTRFAFGNQDQERTARSVRERVQFFTAYPYLREAVDAYIEREAATTLRRTQFKSMLQRVDEQMTADYDAADWMRLIDPLFRLMELTPHSGVPVSFLQTFFQGKSATAIVQRLQAASLEHGTTTLDRSDLRDLLTASTPSSGDTAPANAAATPPRSEPAASETPPTHNAAASAPSDNGAAPPSSSPNEAPSGNDSDGASNDAPDQDGNASTEEPASNGPTPLWKQFQDAGGLSSDPAPPERTAPEPSPSSSSAGGEAPLWQRFRPAATPSEEAGATPSPPASEAAASEAAASLEPLERAVLGDRGPSNRDLFVRELFGGSHDDYRQTLRRLREAPNWTRASQIIAQDVFRAHRVNIYSEPAVLFTNAVEDRFRQRS